MTLQVIGTVTGIEINLEFTGIEQITRKFTGILDLLLSYKKVLKMLLV